MARFSGNIGYASQVEKAVDVWEDGLIERSYFGEINKDAKRWYTGDAVHDKLKIVNKISVVADSYANNNFENIRYVKLKGKLLDVIDVEIAYPRLILTLGGTYNGPTPS